MKKITAEDLEKEIAAEMYHRFAPTTTTVCCLVLKNGFTVTGQSSCLFSDDYNEEIGKKVARERAIDKIWSYLGFRERDSCLQRRK